MVHEAVERLRSRRHLIHAVLWDLLCTNWSHRVEVTTNRVVVAILQGVFQTNVAVFQMRNRFHLGSMGHCVTLDLREQRNAPFAVIRRQHMGDIMVILEGI